MKRLGWLVLAVLLASGSAIAQKAPAADPAKVAAATALLETSGSLEDYMKIFGQMKSAVTGQMKGQSPEVLKNVDALFDRLGKPDNPVLKTYMDDVKSGMIAFYSEKFTLDELDQIKAFQASDAGKKFRVLQPELMATLSGPMMKFQQGLMIELQKEMQKP